MADALEDRREAGGIKCVLLQAAVPAGASRICPFHHLACGPGAAVTVITIWLTGEPFSIEATIRMRGPSRSGCRSTSLRHNLRG